MNGVLSIRIILTLIIIMMLLVGLGFLKPILWPFALSIVLAYIFDPITSFFDKFGFSRIFSSLIVVFIFLLLLFGFLATLLPIFVSQINAVMEIVPVGLEILTEKLNSVGITILEIDVLKNEFIQNIKGSLGSTAQIIIDNVSEIAQDAFFFVLVPIMLFYLLKDWESLRKTILKAVPPRMRVNFSELINDIDISVSGFLRGQLTVMFILGTFYSIALSILGLYYAIAIGVLTGILVFIPYVGAFIGVCIASLIGIIQYENVWSLLPIWGIFAFAQSVESVVLTPNIVGDKVGLHPVWIIFALMGGGLLFGFIGVLLAVPMATFIGTIVRFIFKQYLKTEFYEKGN